MPELELRGSVSFSLLIAVLHGLVVVALLQLPAAFLWLLPVAVLSLLLTVAKYGLLLLSRSVRKIRLAHDGWYLGLNNQVQLGPFELDDATRLDSGYLRLSLRRSALERRHLIINREMIGADQFRRLSVFLRWASEKGQQPEAANLRIRLTTFLAQRLPAGPRLRKSSSRAPK